MSIQLIKWMIALWAVGGGFAYAQVTPFNSWRALIIYTNAAVDSAGGEGVNFYQDYFASLFDDLNHAYEESEVDAHAQIAGVIWDKTYAEYHPEQAPGYGGCGNRDDLASGAHGIQRYVDLLERYAADMLIMIHPNPTLGGCAEFLGTAEARGYGVFWVTQPDNSWLWSHEMGHVHDVGHCSGHRLTLNSSGVPLGGPIPYAGDTMSFIVGDSLPFGRWADYVVDDSVETDYTHADRGFHTTMSYEDEGEAECRVYTILDTSNYLDMHTYGGRRRSFSFHTRGLWLPDHAPTSWAGVYSNPNVPWTDEPTNTQYPTGGNFGYIRRLKYRSADTVTYRDTVWRYYDEAAIVQASANTLSNLRGVPADLVLSSDMSLGQNAADSQWVYAHFAATNSVTIEPGFSLAAGASMRISVGTSGEPLAKSAFKRPGDKNIRMGAVAASADFLVKYNPSAKTVSFSLGAGPTAKVTALVYNIRGARKMKTVFSHTDNSLFTETISIRDLPDGIYLLRVVVDDRRFERQFVKW